MAVLHPVASSRSGREDGPVTVICFSHLRWNFVFQRPQHLMTRAQAGAEVIYWEEPVLAAGPVSLVEQATQSGVRVVTPHLPESLAEDERARVLKSLLDELLDSRNGTVVAWYYTPMMLPFSRHRPFACTVYDCMDELANFRFAPPELLPLECELLERADLVFTGGYSLYEAKRDRHPHVYPFPSSVDRSHFGQARSVAIEPDDQRSIPTPRLGFYGVIDERMDLDLLASLADARPDWSLVMVGPVVKIGEDELPRRPNIHYLGGKDYGDLPAYLAGWQASLMPFAMNDATRFISPTKTPEYLAGGVPVVSTPIADVVRHFGTLGGVEIAEAGPAFTQACERALALPRTGAWLAEADSLLETMSWDETFQRMWGLVEGTLCAHDRTPRVVSPLQWPAERPAAYDVMVVGCGFAGAVMAERLARASGKRVLVVDRRPHIAGNAYDRRDDAGLLIHQYGPHIFHTNSAEIFDYLSQFTSWRPYEHRVLAKVGDLLVPIPINRTTLNSLYGLDLASDEDAAAFLASRAQPVDVIETSADVVVSAVGRELYETFFRGYTRKQWGLDPSELDKSVTARVPTRTSTDDRYFTDRFQAMPREGYTRMFERMLDHPNIDLLLGAEYRDVRRAYPHGHLVFTGCIDEYFDYRFGRLPYRSLRFEHETLPQEWLQPVAVVNYPDEVTPFTRVTEYKHLTGDTAPRTSITREYPSAEGDPYYPIPQERNQELYRLYEALAKQEAGTTFVGRLATYRYYNMDQVVGQALATFRKKFAPAPEAPPLETTDRSVGKIEPMSQPEPA